MPIDSPKTFAHAPMDKLIRDIIQAHYTKCVARVVHRLRRFPAEGVGGDGSPLRTLWDLWKWEIQEEQPVLHDLIDEMVESVIRGFVDQLPPEQGALMTLITDAQDDLDEDQAEPFFDREAVTAELLQRVSDRACDEPHRGEVQRYLDAVARDRFERDMEGSG